MKPPPLSPYGVFVGQLFQYSTSPSLIAFESSPRQLDRAMPSDALPNASKKCILLGGLGDGPIPTPYAKLLEEKCHGLGWSLVQPICFGNGSLARDSEELVKLMEYLCCHHNAKRFALIGHSTGCQNSVHLLKFGKKEMVDRLKVVALQAPVSDRESLYMNPGDHSSNISHARALASAGKGEEMMPRSAFWAPITASRYLSLFDVRSATGLPGGEDDFFSSDLTDEELQGRLGHVGKIGTETGLHLLAAFSKKDEYVPDSVDTDLLLKRMVDAMNGESSGRAVAEGLILENANHNLSQGRGDKEEFVDAVGRLMEQVVSED